MDTSGDKPARIVYYKPFLCTLRNERYVRLKRQLMNQPVVEISKAEKSLADSRIKFSLPCLDVSEIERDDSEDESSLPELDKYDDLTQLLLLTLFTRPVKFAREFIYYEDRLGTSQMKIVAREIKKLPSGMMKKIFETVLERSDTGSVKEKVSTMILNIVLDLVRSGDSLTDIHSNPCVDLLKLAEDHKLDLISPKVEIWDPDLSPVVCCFVLTEVMEITLGAKKAANFLLKHAEILKNCVTDTPHYFAIVSRIFHKLYEAKNWRTAARLWDFDSNIKHDNSEARRVWGSLTLATIMRRETCPTAEVLSFVRKLNSAGF